MADISITRNHSYDKDKVRDLVQELVDKLVARHGGSYNWVGDEACYNFTGVDATLCFDDEQVRVDVKLSFLMKALKKVIEQEITSYMDSHGMT